MINLYNKIGCEIGLRPYQFCNLIDLNGSDIVSREDYLDRSRKGAFIATLQAGYTDFHYLRPIWQTTTEEDALIGVGVTGIAANKINPEWLKEAASEVRKVNEETAKKIGINPAARTTTIKPSGTSSLVLGSSSGIHAYHNDFYIRRIRYGKDEAIWKYLSTVLPELCEDEKFRPQTQGVLTIPQRSPIGSVVRTETPIELLERVRTYNIDWVAEGHNRGDNKNNVSCTISLKDDEWEPVGQWMWENREHYNGISVLPYDGGTYVQAPFEDTSEATYFRMIEMLKDIDLKQIIEEENNTTLVDELACAADGCVVV